jgi:hypothetical protein
MHNYNKMINFIKMILYIVVFTFSLLVFTYILNNILLHLHIITTVYDGTVITTCLVYMCLLSLALIFECGCYVCLDGCLYYCNISRKRINK